MRRAQRDQESERDASHPPAMHMVTLSAMNCRQMSQLGRAHGEAHADFLACAGHAYQHHVHDDDAADHHRNRTHHHEHGKKCAADAAPQSHVTFFGADEEVVVLSGARWRRARKVSRAWSCAGSNSLRARS